ncbi:MAG: hypothetical protein JXB23_14280 [Candidatus Aminicenantes bacterium]|nr:hypothetical protein [Candidatus Aminicenantes bacterium]
MCINPKREEKELEALLPGEINGWKSGEDRIYDPDTIFDYLNGSGEVYRAFNFRRLLARPFFKEDRQKIIADIFDMATDKDAFGIFSHGYEGEDAGIGQGSSYAAGLLSFWKGRFFISLYAVEETEESKEALFALARRIAFAIKQKGRIPKVVSFLPPEGLGRTSIRYFHNHLILNYHFFVADANILHLDQNTEVVLGFYEEHGERYALLLIVYPEEGEAKKAFASFLNAYMPDASEEGIVRTEDGKWTAGKQVGDLLILVFNAFSGLHSQKVLAKVFGQR